MDDFLPHSAKLLLGILAAAFILGIVSAALIYMNDITETVNRDSEAARYQREYASLRRYQSEEFDIAYTEVLNAIYLLSENDRPVIVIPTAVWTQHNPINGTRPEADRLLRFPLPFNDIRMNFFGSPDPSVTFLSTGASGFWADIPYNPTVDTSTYKAVSEWLANISRTCSKLSFQGHVLRNDSGVAYSLVFVYRTTCP